MNEREQKIYDLWQQNFSTAIMAGMLGISKNAICGIVHRLRLRGVTIPKRGSRPMGLITLRVPKPIEEKKPRPPKKDYGPRFARLFDRAVMPDQVVEIEKKPAAKLTGKNVMFWGLTSKSCRYVINDGKPEDFIFCGKEKERGPYCKEHAAICYNVPNYEQRREIRRANRFT